jgi:hypothetical protein
MSRKAKGKGFKMKGHALPGINQRSETPSMKDGRSPSSPFQQGPTPMKQVTIPGVTVSGEPGEFIGDWKETKNKIKNMSRRELRREWADMVDQMGDQDYYYDRTRKLKIPIPKRFSSRAEKEDFILKQTMKNYQKPDESQAMTHETYKKFIDAGIDPATMKDIDNSPLEQLVDRLPSEIEDLEPYTGDNVVEQINDLEERIGFINENKSTYGRDLNEQEKKDLTVLNTELQKLRNDQRMEEALKRDEELGPNPDEVD